MTRKLATSGEAEELHSMNSGLLILPTVVIEVYLTKFSNLFGIITALIYGSPDRTTLTPCSLINTHTLLMRHRTHRTNTFWGAGSLNTRVQKKCGHTTTTTHYAQLVGGSSATNGAN